MTTTRSFKSTGNPGHYVTWNANSSKMEICTDNSWCQCDHSTTAKIISKRSLRLIYVCKRFSTIINVIVTIKVDWSGMFISNYRLITEKCKIDDFNSHFNELINLNKLRQKKSKSKTLGSDFQQNVSKVLFYQFLKVNKTLEQAMIYQLYDTAMDLNSILTRVCIVVD